MNTRGIYTDTFKASETPSTQAESQEHVLDRVAFILEICFLIGFVFLFFRGVICLLTEGMQGILNLSIAFQLVGTIIPGVAWFVIALSTAPSTIVSRITFGLRRELKSTQQIGQYVLEEKLGEGGMGVVYRARHAMLRRPTAVKLIRNKRTDEETRSRFQREVQLTAQLSHPNTVTVFDYGCTGEGVFYYAMELLDGANLEEIVEATGPQPAARVVHVLEQMAGSLEEAHAVGMVHGDIKPGNIILCERGGLPDRVKVVDFGLARELLKTCCDSSNGSDEIVGTPSYMPPEAFTSPDAVDGRSDIYALGAVGYYLLTGSQVFSATTALEMCVHQLNTAPISPSKRLGAVLPDQLERLLLSCLEKDPSLRPVGASALWDQLRDVADVVGPWSVEAARRWWYANETSIRRCQGRLVTQGLGAVKNSINIPGKPFHETNCGAA